jgi:DNA-binding MarR family transcriptional regulator
MDTRTQTLQDLFAVAQLTQRLMHGCVMRAFHDMDIAPSQAHLLHMVEQMQPVSFKSLASELRLSPGAVTQLVDGLVQAELVKRTPDETDRRVSNVELTRTGKEKLSILKEKKRELLANVLKDLSDEELELYVNAQRKMLAYLEANYQDNKTK